MPTALIVGAGPAGLMAAETLAQAGWKVTILEALASPARKFLRAGVGGLNLTHSQPLEAFLGAYGPARPRLEPFLRSFGPAEVSAWAQGLGIPLFTGSSGRVFPEGLGAGPLLGAWVARLEGLGVELVCRTRWTAWSGARGLVTEGPDGPRVWEADAVVLALGGPTWPALGTGGAWVPLLADRGVSLGPWRPANVGFLVDWTPHFAQKFPGQPLKDSVLAFDDGRGPALRRRGEFMVTPWGLEGGPLYALGARLRGALEAGDRASITLDLVPDRDLARVRSDLGRPRNGRSLATHLQKTVGVTGVKAGLLREALPPGAPDDPDRVVALLKALPLDLVGTRPLAEAISAAGGVAWDELTDALELRRLPGVFCAGEMIDWEAPTGGYLLTACFSLGRAVATALVTGSRGPGVS